MDALRRPAPYDEGKMCALFALWHSLHDIELSSIPKIVKKMHWRFYWHDVFWPRVSHITLSSEMGRILARSNIFFLANDRDVHLI